MFRPAAPREPGGTGVLPAPAESHALLKSTRRARLAGRTNSIFRPRRSCRPPSSQGDARSTSNLNAGSESDAQPHWLCQCGTAFAPGTGRNSRWARPYLFGRATGVAATTAVERNVSTRPPASRMRHRSEPRATRTFPRSTRITSSVSPRAAASAKRVLMPRAASSALPVVRPDAPSLRVSAIVRVARASMRPPRPPPHDSQCETDTQEHRPRRHTEPDHEDRAGARRGRRPPG